MDSRRHPCHRTHLDTYTDWSGEPVLAADAVPTGEFSMRRVTVRPLVLYVVEVVDQYAPRRLDAHPSEEEALASAREVMAEPDSRGIEREWVER